MSDNILRKVLIDMINNINTESGSGLKLFQTKLYLQKYQVIPQRKNYGNLWIRQRKNKSYEIAITGQGLKDDMASYMESYFNTPPLVKGLKLSWIATTTAEVNGVVRFLAFLDVLYI